MLVQILILILVAVLASVLRGVIWSDWYNEVWYLQIDQPNTETYLVIHFPDGTAHIHSHGKIPWIVRTKIKSKPRKLNGEYGIEVLPPTVINNLS